MFSQSNSYLGGSVSGRPGGPPYSQSPFAPQQAQQPQQQQQGLPPQQTGFGAGLQPQYTGYPGQQPQQLQQQYTGYPGQNGSFQGQPPPQQPPPQQQSFQQQPTGFAQAQQPPAAPQQQPQPTGMTSSQMANSFKGPSSQAEQRPQPTGRSSKIPNQRLSFVTATDQAKFEQLFKSAVGNSQALSGDQARDLLLRSQLPGDKLSQIWTLADTTKSGQLLFPEFALAMYLCNLALVGKSIPGALPDRIKNEVSSMVDIISFAIPEDSAQQPQQTNAPNFSAQPPQPQQPSNSQILSSLAPQATGYPQQQQSFQPQPAGFAQQQTGYQQPQQFQPQPTGLPPQQTGYPTNPQATGYSGPRPPMPAMPTGFQQSAQTGMAPLNAQPTGRPGQWGLVNAPASGLPNIEALQQQMMPQPGREGGFTTTGLRGNATVPWAVTKDEKTMYDSLFKAWDGFGKGFITGSQSIEIMGQSGLGKSDLEKIWTLSDPSNRGRLDLDEFAVAMHLIYRALNGYPVPNRLPPELVPPSTRNLNASLGAVKSLLSRDAEERKSSTNYLEPQKTGVSYLKNHSFSGASTNGSFGRKDATMYKHNDEDVGYRSSARHRLGGDARSPSPAQTPSPASESADEISLDHLQKIIREKQVLLDAIDFQDENEADQDEVLDRKDRKDAEDLYRRIRRIQEDIDSHPNASLRSSDSGAERRTLKRQLQGQQDRLPDLASQVRRTERAIVDARLELFRLKDVKASPGSAPAIVGTGSGGAVTESDRMKARAKAMMQQRSAALTGKAAPGNADDSAAATRRFEEESSRVRTEKDNNDRMVKDVEEGVATYSRSVEDTLREGQDDTQNHEKRRWEDALGVEDEIKEFIFDLQRSSRAARVRKDDRPRDRTARPADDTRSRPVPTEERNESPAPQTESSARASPAPQGGNYSSYKTPEERAAFIKQQAEQRMAERLAALGLRTPAKSGETAQQKEQRQAKEREERLRQAEAEDAKLEAERQRRLENESIAPPVAAGGKAGKKAPPAPPSRSAKSEPQQQGSRQADADVKRAENEIAEQALKEQQTAQEAQVKSMEDEQHRQEAELQRQREEANTRRLALEERVRQSKLGKEEEKARKKAAKREAEETKAREERLAAQRAEVEAAKQQEAELQRQLEALENDDESSDDEGPQQITPTDSTPVASQELPRETAAEPPAAPAMAPPSIPQVRSPEPETFSTPPAVASPPPASTDPGSNNPFFKRMQSADTSASTNASSSTAPITSPPPAPAPQTDTNPFHRMSNAASNPTQPFSTSAPPLVPSTTGGRRARAASEDDWSVVDSSSDDDDDEEDESTTRGGAKHLASILFGTMGPPRPMSAVAGESAGVNASPATGAPLMPPPMPGMDNSIGAPGSPPPPPPPPPPMPGSDTTAAPGAPPPPPPMMPPAAPPTAPAMPSLGGSGGAGAGGEGGGGGGGGGNNRGALLGQIQSGRGLKKVQTKDRSASGVAGRVLG